MFEKGRFFDFSQAPSTPSVVLCGLERRFLHKGGGRVCTRSSHSPYGLKHKDLSILEFDAYGV